MPSNQQFTGDMAIQAVGNFSQAAPTPKKPPYIILLEAPASKISKQGGEKFISLDRPNAINGFVEVRGFFCSKSEDEIIKTFATLLTTTPKDIIMEVMFPAHRIVYIRNLIFNANKTLK